MECVRVSSEKRFGQNQYHFLAQTNVTNTWYDIDLFNVDDAVQQ